MTKKPRNKRHSFEARYVRTARHTVRNMAIVYTLGNQPKIVHAATGKPLALTQELYRAFHTVQHDWRIYLSVMLETSQGEKYVKTLEASPERPCYKEDVTDSISEAHIDFIKTTRRADRVNVGWLALPRKVDLTEADIVALYETQDCWDQYERGTAALDCELSLDEQLQLEYRG